MAKINKRRFVLVPENMLLNKDISYSAIGVFAFLNMFEDGEELPKLKNLGSEISELEKFGYLKIKDGDIHLKGV